jgi:hypothetical protein
MLKKTITIINSVICLAVLTACASSPVSAQTPAVSSMPAVSPSVSASAPQSEATSANASAAASGPDTPLTDAGITLEDIIKEDSLNKNLANFDSLKFPGESIEAAIQGNTLTFFVTLDQDMEETDLTQDMKDQYTSELISLINTLDEEYEGFPDCTFVYNLMSQSGDTLLTLTQDYMEQ